jgi:methionyl-tRNA formyltransferase
LGGRDYPARKLAMAADRKPLFAFFGTPKFAVYVLSALEAQGLMPALVVTAPDKKRGRGQALSPAPAKEWAQARGIDVATPATLKDGAFIAELGNTAWDVFVVAAYGKLLAKTILEMPRGGALNIHPSLLPKYRGPSPALSCILADERETGVSVMQMSEAMDAGPVVAQARIEIAPEDWPPKGSLLEEMLATEGGNLLAEVLPDWLDKKIEAMPQDEAAATYTRKFTDEDARLDLAGDARQNFLKIRAFDAGPRAYFVDAQGKRVIVTEADCKDGALEILKVIPEGKKEMPYADFQRGQK